MCKIMMQQQRFRYSNKFDMIQLPSLKLANLGVCMMNYKRIVLKPLNQKGIHEKLTNCERDKNGNQAAIFPLN